MPKAQREDPAVEQPNPIQVLGKAIQESKLAARELTGILGRTTDTYHGTLQVALSALRRAENSVVKLIEIEEA